MPELPEVETIVRDLRPHLVGRTIQSAKLSHDDVLRGVTKRKLVSALAGARIVGMTRRAKHADRSSSCLSPRALPAFPALPVSSYSPA